MNPEDKAKVQGKTAPSREAPVRHQGKPALGQAGTGSSVKKVDQVIRRAPQMQGEIGSAHSAARPHNAEQAQPVRKKAAPSTEASRRNTEESIHTPVKKKPAAGTAAPKAAASQPAAAQRPLRTFEDVPEREERVLRKGAAQKNDQTRKSEKAKKDSGAKKASKKAGKKSGSGGGGFMRLGKGLKTGSVTISTYGKKALNMFDSFATSETDSDKTDTFFKNLVRRLGLEGKLRFSSFLLGSLVVLILTLVFFNNTNLLVEHVTVSIAGLDSDLEGYTICLLSDMHGREFGTKQATLLRTINGEEYDLMLLAGDMVGIKGNPQPLYDLLDGVESKAPIYFIAGDSDPGPLRSKPNVVEGLLEEFVLEEWVLGAMERGAIYLDSPERLEVEDAVIWLTPGSMLNVESSSTVSALNLQEREESDAVIAGVPEAYDTLPFTAYRQQNMLRLQEQILEMQGEDLHISVAHIPPHDPIRTSDGKDGYLPTVDLIVGGHYCGGVWQIPMMGPLYIPAVEAERHGWLPARNEAEGLRMLGSANLYVTAGLGVTDQINLPDFRLYNRPRVTILHLTAKLTDDLLGLND